jgi:hypothetical protein
MADTLNRKISINYQGGSIEGSYGLMLAVFGENKVGASMVPEEQAITRSQHDRVRVIGQPGQSIAQTSYIRKKYPSSRSSGPAGGEPIKVFYAGDWWTMRLTGNHEAFNDFLGGILTEEEAGGGAIYWRSEKGTKYGPFARP